jgi:hypothetical protein
VVGPADHKQTTVVAGSCGLAESARAPAATTLTARVPAK